MNPMRHYWQRNKRTSNNRFDLSRSLSSFLLGGAVRRKWKKEKWRLRGQEWRQPGGSQGELAGQAYVILTLRAEEKIS